MPRINTQLRNQHVRDMFQKISNKHPQWRVDAVIDEVAKSHFLSTRTVEAILRYETGSYAS